MNYRRMFLIGLSIMALLSINWTVVEAQDGKGIFKSKGCGDCHAVEGPSKLTNIKDRVKQKGPDLWFAGSKFKTRYLKTWLEKPSDLTGVKYSELLPVKGKNSHPALSGKEASDVSNYLMTLKDKEMATGIIDDKKKMKRSALFKAGTLFQKTQVCFGCHLFKPKKRAKRAIGGFSGPSLVGAKKRLTGDWVYSYLKDQKRYVPLGRMPIYQGPTFQAYPDKDLKALAQYIVNLY